LKVIEGDIKSNRDKIKAIKGDVVSICEDIRNVKDILSRKANFTDIIHQVERKADKEDFKELSARMQETSQQLISKNLNESISLSRADKTERDRARASSLSRANKTLMAPRSATNRANKTDLDVGSKLFICGIDAQYG
jgi:arsenate reductase-like glutaredoxin family protein